MFKTLAKMWLEAKGISEHKQYIFILQPLGKVIATGNLSLTLAAPNNS